MAAFPVFAPGGAGEVRLFCVYGYDLKIGADDEEVDQVLPAGDMSIFADLGLDEMELAAICSRLDLDSDDDPWDHVEDAVESIASRLGFGLAMERALDVALGS